MFDLIKKKKSSVPKISLNKNTLHWTSVSSVKKNNWVWKIRLKKRKLVRVSKLLNNKWVWKLENLVINKFELKSNDQRAWIISIYLVLLVLFISSVKVFFPSKVTDLDAFAFLIALLYGIDIVIVIYYFIRLQIGVVLSRFWTAFFDFVLIFNLSLASITFLFLMLYALEFWHNGNASDDFSYIVGSLLGLSSGSGLFFILYPLALFLERTSNGRSSKP